MKWPARGSLVWRLYALGLAQLVLLAASVALVGYLLRPVLNSGPGGPPARPPAGFSPGAREGRGDGPGSPPAPPHRPPGPWGPLATFFASGVLIVDVGAVLSWRWMVQPVAHLSRAARALGAGNLGVRARLTRGDELGELGRGFDDMAERIEGLVLTQKELLANVSHELRTPLARIRVALDIASEGDAGAARSSLEEIAVDLGGHAGPRSPRAEPSRAGADLRLHRTSANIVGQCRRACARFRALCSHPRRVRDLRIVTVTKRAAPGGPSPLRPSTSPPSGALGRPGASGRCF